MSKEKCIVRQIRSYKEAEGEIYAFINLIEKKVYIGETGNVGTRELTHAKCIFGLQNKGSNNNLIDENQINSYCLMYLSFLPEKNDNQSLFLAMETIYMYLFVKNGFKLYNSNRGKDNLGKTRKFLIKLEDKTALRNATLNYLKENADLISEVIDGMGERRAVANWEEFIKIAEEELKKELAEKIFDNFFEVLDRRDRNELWNEFVNKKKASEDFIIIDEMKSEQDFFVFNKKRLKVVAEGYQPKEISIRELINTNIMNEIIYTKVGDYLGEPVYDILANKFLDLKRGVDPFYKKGQEKKFPRCFWAVHGDQQDWIRKKFFNNGNKEVYLLLAYTGSKSLSKKQETEITAKTFSLNRKSKEQYTYPESYSKAIIGKGNNMAFVISDFYYTQENIKGYSIEETYTAMFESISDEYYIANGSKQKNFYVARLKEQDKNRLKNLLDCNGTNSNQTGIIVAKLEYPYVVALES